MSSLLFMTTHRQATSTRGLVKRPYCRTVRRGWARSYVLIIVPFVLSASGVLRDCWGRLRIFGRNFLLIYLFVPVMGTFSRRVRL